MNNEQLCRGNEIKEEIQNLVDHLSEIKGFADTENRFMNIHDGDRYVVELHLEFIPVNIQPFLQEYVANIAAKIKNLEKEFDAL